MNSVRKRNALPMPLFTANSPFGSCSWYRLFAIMMTDRRRRGGHAKRVDGYHG